MILPLCSYTYKTAIILTRNIIDIVPAVEFDASEPAVNVSSIFTGVSPPTNEQDLSLSTEKRHSLALYW